ncbi:MAG: hypothetical protein H0X42_07995 [Solirubrobacterales bacterium]|nr:hypothetical protein [Solirubrobacterales bacterium]
MRLKTALIGFAVLFAVTAAAALAADPTDMGFGTKGIAEIEARAAPREDAGQVGGIADLQPTRDGKMLAAVYPIAIRGHFFAAARIDPNGALDRSFGKDGFTPYINAANRKGGDSAGVLQAEAVAGLKDGKVLVAGYDEDLGVFAPALAQFTAKGRLDPRFGHGGKVLPLPSYGGRPISTEGGGERLRDVAIEPDGTIVGVGDIIGGIGEGPRRPGAVVVAYRPNGEIDRAFGHDGRLRFLVSDQGRYSGYTGFTEVKALPSGKLLISGYIHQRYVLYRLTADGRIDRSFGHDGRVAFAKPGARAVKFTSFFEAPFTVDSRGRIVVCVPLFPEGGEEPIAFERLLPDGRRDPSFGRSPYMERAPIDGKEPARREPGVQYFSFSPLAVAIDGHGRILVTGGESAPYTRGQKEPGHEDFTSRRFLPDGRRDRSFGEGGVWHTDPPGSQSLARAALNQPDGKVVAGGWVQIDRGGGNGPSNTAMLLTRYG